MTILAKHQELLDVEQRFWSAMKREDAQGAARMTDDGCIAGDPYGRDRAPAS